MKSIDIFKKECEKANISISEKQLEQFDSYKQLLIEWNNKINLTAITEEKEIMIKHFLDCLLPLILIDIKKNKSIIDVGTGAGFPAIPFKIMRPDLKVTMLDSLNKRLIFLQEVCSQLNLEKYNIIHSRAEDGGCSAELREKYDYATARAVANLAVLCEYCLPYVKVGGYFIALKGPASVEELKNSENAIKILGGKIEKIIEYNLLDEGKRSLIVIKKISSTPMKYPRQRVKINKNPII